MNFFKLLLGSEAQSGCFLHSLLITFHCFFPDPLCPGGSIESHESNCAGNIISVQLWHPLLTDVKNTGPIQFGDISSLVSALAVSEMLQAKAGILHLLNTI